MSTTTAVQFVGTPQGNPARAQATAVPTTLGGADSLGVLPFSQLFTDGVGEGAAQGVGEQSVRVEATMVAPAVLADDQNAGLDKALSLVALGRPIEPDLKAQSQFDHPDVELISAVAVELVAQDTELLPDAGFVPAWSNFEGDVRLGSGFAPVGETVLPMPAVLDDIEAQIAFVAATSQIPAAAKSDVTGDLKAMGQATSVTSASVTAIGAQTLFVVAELPSEGVALQLPQAARPIVSIGDVSEVLLPLAQAPKNALQIPQFASAGLEASADMPALVSSGAEVLESGAVDAEMESPDIVLAAKQELKPASMDALRMPFEVNPGDDFKVVKAATEVSVQQVSPAPVIGPVIASASLGEAFPVAPVAVAAVTARALGGQKTEAQFANNADILLEPENVVRDVASKNDLAAKGGPALIENAKPISRLLADLPNSSSNVELETDQTLSTGSVAPASGSGSSGGAGGNAGQSAPLLPSSGAGAAATLIDVRRQGWTKTLVARAAGMGTGGGTMTLTILPQHLGQITLKLSEGRKGFDLRMTAEVASTAAMLRDVQGQIESAFEQAGLSLGSYSAQTGGQGEQGNSAQGEPSGEASMADRDEAVPAENTASGDGSMDDLSRVNILL
ncbi:flagellar hook-length control protein FliK [Planktotalea arctica]|uniref:flagellar hook-length control protein FliK n=1 Tax=Planktotalea arctica TaxID=1481893 RepID=UPI00321AE402